IKPLCVNLLGNDKEAINDLELSVREITNRLSYFDLSAEKEKINNSEEKLEKSKERKAFLENTIIEIREKATRSYQFSKNYTGNLIEIAQKISFNKDKCNWFQDKINNLENIDDSCDKILNFVKLHESFSSINFSNYDFTELAIEEIIKPDEIVSYIELLKEIPDLKNKIERKDLIPCFEQLEDETFDKIHPNLSNSMKLLDKIDNYTSKWTETVINDCLKGFDKTWIHINEESSNILNKEYIKKTILHEKHHRFEYPENKSLQQLKADSQFLIDYINSGNKLDDGFKLFKPKGVKERWYILKEVFVDGSPCDTKEELELFNEYIDININIERLFNLWGDIIPKVKSATLQLKNFEDFNDKLSSILKLIKEFSLNISCIRELTNLQEKVSDKKVLIDLLNICSFAIKNNQLSKNEDQIKASINYLESYKQANKPYPLADDVLKSLKDSNYSNAINLLEELNKWCLELRDFSDYHNAIKSMQNEFPLLVKQILEKTIINFEDLSNNLSATLEWSYAKTYLENLNKENSIINYENELKEIEDEIKNLVANLASMKSWYALQQNIDRNDKEHLIGWYQAIKKIGKGTGKKAWRFRKQAQSHMKYCRKAIPAWIMPLYRVAESIDPDVGIFDYIIVDEASQLGPDALCLLYLTKKIIIVGDDKQTAPEYVGVTDLQVTQLIEKHLKEVKFKDRYAREYSFFDHAFLFCNANDNGMIVLKEHFRCMPEIIEFCNKQFYAPSGMPLNPMRQYSENRIAPIKGIYMKSGHTEGNSPNLINKPEANKIAEMIKEIIEGSNSENITIGVISLQGRAQAYFIEKVLLDSIGPEKIEKHKIVCGDSTSFQGDERHVIFLSMIVSPSYRFTALTTPNYERRFNVAVSRAKDQLVLCHSIQLNDLTNKEDLRYKLLEYIYNDKIKLNCALTSAIDTNNGLIKPFESKFEIDVFNKIVTKGFKVIPQYKVGRFRIDLAVVLDNGIKIGIECDGDKFHGIDQYQNDMLRQKILERCGWQFFRIRGCEFYAEKDTSLEPLWQLIKRNQNYKIVKSHKTSSTLDTVQNTSEIEQPVSLNNKPALVNNNDSLSTELYQSSDLWFKISHWGKETDLLFSTERRIAYNIGRHINNNWDLSDKLKKAGDNIHSKAFQNGFKPEEISKKEPSSPSITEEELIDVLEIKSISISEDDIKNIHTVINLKNKQVVKLIIDTLLNCPNYSATKDSLSTKVLKKHSIVSRGIPRQKFERKLLRVLSKMEKHKLIEIYTSKNIRVRLSKGLLKNY
ncbi:MAG: hypothetical protein GY730_04880, partial [bacterium]|nr:hypothetical protein [bacterium]